MAREVEAEVGALLGVQQPGEQQAEFVEGAGDGELVGDIVSSLRKRTKACGAAQRAETREGRVRVE